MAKENGESSTTSSCSTCCINNNYDENKKICNNHVKAIKTNKNEKIVSATINTATNDSTGTIVPFVPVTVDENDIIGGAKEILKAIRPNWNLNDIDYKLFTDGITNKLIGCFHKEQFNDLELSSSSSSIPDNNTECDTRNVVLIRVYGNKTDLLIDRKAETKNIELLHTYGFAPSLYGIFNNGLCYEYIPGCTLRPDTVMLPKIWKLIAKRMAEMHKVVDETNTIREPMLAHKTEQFLKLIPEKFNDPKKHAQVEEMFLPVEKLRNEFEYLFNHLLKLNSPVVFSHNDLLLGNVIYTESCNRVTFIDYEYADYNYQAFDIGNHFAEFAGIDGVDYSRYPPKEYQYAWLEEYLKNYLNVSEVKSNDIQRLYVQVNQFALASHYFWAIWALIQTEHSTIDFDFASFAKIRYQEYLTRRDEFLSLKYDE